MLTRFPPRQPPRGAQWAYLRRLRLKRDMRSILALLVAAGCARAIEPPASSDASTSGSGDDVKEKPDGYDPFADDLGEDDVGPKPSDTGIATRDTGTTARDVSVGTDSPAPPPPPPPPPVRCGAPGQVCCTGARCDMGAMCMGGACAEQPMCGSYNQPCCGSAACGPGLNCSGGVCTASGTCGASGQACCTTGSFCQPFLLCTGSRCVPCGNPGQSCCSGAPTCFRSLRCETSLCVM